MSDENKKLTEDELWAQTRSDDPRERAHAYSHLADHAMHRGEWEAAAAIRAEEVAILRDLGDYGYALALMMQAMATSLAGNPEAALNIFDQALDQGRASVPDDVLAEIMSSKSELLAELGRTEEAIKLLEASRDMFASAGRYGRSAAMSNELGMIHARAWRYTQAEVNYENAMRDYKADFDSIGFAKSRDLLASVLNAQDKFEQAHALLQENLDLYAFHDDKDQAMYSTYRSGWNLLSMGNAHEGFELINLARDHYLANKNMVDRLGLEIDYIDSLRAVGRIDDAEQAARQLRAFLRSVDDDRHLIVLELNLAKWALAKGDDEFGESTLWSVIKRSENHGFKSKAMIARLTLAQYFASNDALKEASAMLEDMIPAEWAENYTRRTAHLNVLACVALGAGELEHASSLCIKVLEFADLRNLHRESALAHLTMANIADEQGSAERALEHRQKAVAFYSQAGCEEDARRVSGLLDSERRGDLLDGIQPDWMMRAGWVERGSSND